MLLKETPENLFYSRKDADDPRLGEHAKSVLPKNLTDQFDFQILGYCDDTGIQINGGRAGAKDAPNQIRTALYKMTVDTNLATQLRIADLGNIQAATELSQTHRDAQELAELAFANGQTISLGGGHDFAYADGSAFLKFATKTSKKKPLIINFDAHLDVRPNQIGNANGNHSGTPFRRLLEDFAGQFEFLEIGIQPQCNSRRHWQWAQDHGALILGMDSFEKTSPAALLSEMLDPDLERPIWISVDIDGFTSNEAPGCSQSWVSGFSYREFLPTLRFLLQNFSALGIGVYEVSPPLDQDNRTSKLAALICYQYIFLKLAGK